jgi:hypothetical protein
MTPEEICLSWWRTAVKGEIDSTDPFFRFIASWVSFNGLYASRFTGGDRAGVRHFARLAQAAVAHEHLLTQDARYAQAAHVLQRKPVRDTGGSDNTYPVADVHDLDQVLNAIYQVRCNLFHGRKERRDFRDRYLVTAGFEIVSRLVGALLDPQLVLPETAVRRQRKADVA